MNCISYSMVRKIFFSSEFPLILEKWWRKEEEERQLRSVLLFYSSFAKIKHFQNTTFKNVKTFGNAIVFI